MSADKVFTEEDVRAHGLEDDAWVIHDGQVLDLSDFVQDHPGGKEILFEHLGTDITDVFRGDGAPHQHSESALEMLHEFRIGRLATSQADKPSARKGETKLPTLDLNKPLVWQTQFLGDHYNTYIHRPQHLKGGKSARFFHSDFLEFHSRTPWYYIPSLWIPVICLLLTGAHLMFNMSLFEMGPYMGTGFVLWSLIEYLLHRFLFHMPERIIHCNRWVTMLHFLIHGCHHLLPMDPMRLVFPPIPAAIISCGVYSVFRTIVTTPYAMVMLAGSLLGYISYDLTHYYLHHASVRGSHFRTMKT